MYSRMPDPLVSGSRPVGGNRPRGVYVPPNYSGTALGQESSPVPDFEALPKVSNLPKASSEALPDRDALIPSHGEAAELSSHHSEGENRAALHGGNSFPFGHGLGYEELFLLGLLLFLRKESSPEADDDLNLTLLLVGALLFCG